MKELPAGLADVLHILSPLSYLLALAILLLVLLLSLFLAWRRLRRRRPATPRTSPGAATPVAGSVSSGIADAIRDLRDRHERTQDYRRGCHELATALRSHFEKKKGRRFSALTATEIVAKFGESSLSKLLGLLADLQFSRAEPTRTEFGEVCDMAAVEVSSRKRS